MDPNVTTTTPAGSTQLGALTSPTCVRFHNCNAERFEAVHLSSFAQTIRIIVKCYAMCPWLSPNYGYRRM